MDREEKLLTLLEINKCKESYYKALRKLKNKTTDVTKKENNKLLDVYLTYVNKMELFIENEMNEYIKEVESFTKQHLS